MIGRALWGCPWKLKEISCAATGKDFIFPIKKMIEYALKHLDLNLKFYGPNGVHAFKKQLPQYIKEISNASSIRRDLLKSQNYEEMKTKLEKLLFEGSLD